MAEDVVRSMGYLCLGTRLKRLGERLQADAQRIIDETGIPVQTTQFPLLAAIDRQGPLSIGDIAETLGVSQPAATRTVALLVKRGLLQMASSPEDLRRRVLTLTDHGQKLISRTWQEACPLIEGSVEDLCGALSGPLLDQLAAIEDKLAETPLHRRAGARREKKA